MTPDHKPPQQAVTREIAAAAGATSAVRLPVRPAGAIRAFGWRGALLAVGLHVAVFAVLLVKLKTPAPPPAPVLIDVTVETSPQGNVVQTEAQPVVPPAIHLPRTDRAAQPLALPLAAQPSVAQDLPLPTQAILPTPAAAKKFEQPSLVAQGTWQAKNGIGVQSVTATRPAVPDAGNPAPIYAASTRALGEQGRVNLGVLILPNGRPGQVTVVKSSGFALLDNAALAAMGNWHFQPALNNGVPVSSVMSYWFDFEIR